MNYLLASIIGALIGLVMFWWERAKEERERADDLYNIKQSLLEERRQWVSENMALRYELDDLRAEAEREVMEGQEGERG